jgi:hypothetical protein
MEPAESALAKLHALAAVVLGEHQNDRDLCAICGTAWPCPRLVLADHNLATM